MNFRLLSSFSTLVRKDQTRRIILCYFAFNIIIEFKFINNNINEKENEKSKFFNLSKIKFSMQIYE